MGEKKAEEKNTMPRRDFIKSTAAAGAGFVIASPFVRAQSRGRVKKVWGPDTLNIGLIVCGAGGEVLMNAARNIPNVRVKAVCDVGEEYIQTLV